MYMCMCGMHVCLCVYVVHMSMCVVYVCYKCVCIVCVWYMCTYLCSIPTHECEEGQKKMSRTLLVTQHIVLRQGLLLN